MRRLLGLTAVLEAATGLALMIAPGTVAGWLFGHGLAGAGAAAGRVAGFALVALGVACGPPRGRPEGTSPALRAMLTYNPLILIYLIGLGVGTNLSGRLLWPAVVLHAVRSLALGIA